MNTECTVDTRADRKGGTFRGALAALAAMVILLAAPAAGFAAGPGGSATAGKNSPVTLESIPGSPAKRVMLTEKAAERLGIKIGKVGIAPVVLKQMVSGLVIRPVKDQPKSKPPGGMFGAVGQGVEASTVAPAGGVFGDLGRGRAAPAQKPAGGIGVLGQTAEASAMQPAAAVMQPAATRPAPHAGEVWVLVTLSPAEWDRLAKDKPARLLPLSTRNKPGKDVFARPSGIAPEEDMKRSMLSLHYIVPGKDHGLAIDSRMRVELQLSGSQDVRKVVPYGAIYYDAKGGAWVYVNTKPLTYERRLVRLERVVGDLAVLTDGPPVGTPVVTVGAPILYGTEVFGK